MDTDLKRRLAVLRQRIVASFESADWEHIERLREQSNVLRFYPKLLLDLNKDGGDYPLEVLSILKFIATNDARVFNDIESYVVLRELDRRSNRPAIIATKFFTMPDLPVLPDLVVVMVPFGKEFSPVFTAIEAVCSGAQLHCRRGDDIWKDDAAMQDVFNLVFHAGIVVADFTCRSPNVLYETGIAHTLQKHVVPISQSLDDVPFDLLRHSVLKYSPDPDGLALLQVRLDEMLRVILSPVAEAVEEAATAKVVPIRPRA